MLRADFVCAVDVGTGSARAGIFGLDGRLVGRAEHPILINRPRDAHAEHDSEDIWRAVCKAVRGAVLVAGVDAARIGGLAFDATCSLVLRGRDARPLTVSTSGEDRWDTIAWLDHRALAEAGECDATGDAALDTAGGAMSPEMQIPKLMWLKRHLPDSWARAGLILDLCDFLSWKATGSQERSQCALTCKWSYRADRQPGWQAGFLQRVGLADLLAQGGLPDRASPAGTDLGPLTPQAADALGLPASCRVGAGLIDAYAAALGVLGPLAGEAPAVERQMVLVAGTSSCVMTLSAAPRRIAGFWGPYFGVALPDCWMTEGGQSATGALLDHIVRLHCAGGEPTPGRHAAIAARIGELRRAEGAGFAARLHVVPDFHGNRSPFGEPQALGVISGLALDASFDGLCRLYFRTAVSIALGVRHILDGLRGAGFDVDILHVTGGHTRNRLLIQLYADTAGCAVREPVDTEAVLLGTAMVASVAAGLHPGLAVAAVAMRQESRVVGSDREAQATLERDYRIFLEMHRHRRAIDALSAQTG